MLKIEILVYYHIPMTRQLLTKNWNNEMDLVKYVMKNIYIIMSFFIIAAGCWGCWNSVLCFRIKIEYEERQKSFFHSHFLSRSQHELLSRLKVSFRLLQSWFQFNFSFHCPMSQWFYIFICFIFIFFWLKTTRARIFITKISCDASCRKLKFFLFLKPSFKNNN